MKKRVVIIISTVILILLSTVLVFAVKKYKSDKLKEEQTILVQKISSHYSDYVITNKETELYKKEDNNYIKAGKINKDIALTLNETQITHDTKYFHVRDFDLYIKYEDVKAIESITKNNRYQNYIYFNKNIITKEITNFYDIEGNYLYTLNSSYDFKALVIDDDRYGVVFNDELLFINKEDVEEIYDSNNTELKNKSRIRTLTYHFPYNPETYNCNQIICHTLEQFESHLKYIKENDYFALNLHELEMYLSGKIQIPEKSIVLTIDDGTIFDTDAIRLLEKYEVVATLFVITGWVGTDHLQSEYLELESHTDLMHNQYECAGMGNQGGGILCLDETHVLTDLKTSQEKLGGSKYFAYPFFDFNDRAINLLKEAGFKLAFIGQYDSDGFSYPNKTNPYMVRRKSIFSTTTMEEFASYLK